MATKLSMFSDEEFKEIVLRNTSLHQIALEIGYTSANGGTGTKIRERIKSLGISTDHFETRVCIKRSPENIFIENSTADQKTLRKYYLNGNYTSYECSICGMLPIWQNKPLTLILDHKNGKNKDDRLENLRWVCPNCNQQLDTTGSKNIVKQKS